MEAQRLDWAERLTYYVRMPSTTLSFTDLSPALQAQAQMLARGLGRDVSAFTFHQGGRHGSTWASLPDNASKWLL